jgi:hypothetical protein
MPDSKSYKLDTYLPTYVSRPYLHVRYLPIDMEAHNQLPSSMTLLPMAATN